MGLEMLPEELLQLTQQWPCREPQLKQLSAVLSVRDPDRDRTNTANSPISLVYPVPPPLSYMVLKLPARAVLWPHVWLLAIYRMLPYVAKSASQGDICWSVQWLLYTTA